MYTFVRAIAVEFGSNQRWKEVDISTTPTSTLFTKYREIYAVLTHELVQDELTLKLADVAADLQVNTGTISEYLSSIGNKALPTVMGAPVIMRNNAVYSDAWAAGFHVDTVDYNVASDVPLPDELKPHLVLTPEADPDDYDFLTFRKKVLATVNGFYHRTAADNRGFYIRDGNKTRRKSNENYVGLLSFATFGELEIHEIKDEDLAFELSAVVGQETRVDKVHLKFEACDLCGKTPILFIGGYMVMIDGENLLMTNKDILTLKTLKYPFLERYFESAPYLDFEGFDIVHTNDNPDWVLRSYFKTEEFLRKYLTMEQSFLVLVDTQHLVLEKVYPEKQTVPHTFMYWGDQNDGPKWPLVVGEGKHEVYWRQYEAGSWVMRAHDTYKRAYMFHTTAAINAPAVDNTLWLGMAGRYGNGYLLKLIDEEIQIKTQ